MTLTDAIYEPAFRLEGFERLDLWDEFHEAAQSVLQDLDARVGWVCPGSTVSSGRNRGRSWGLFTYRVYGPPPGRQIDPVVVGITFCEGPATMIMLSADIAGETGGDVLMAVPSRQVMGKLAVLEAARDLSEQMAQQASLVGKALMNPARAI
jgi:hypothetical protein